MRLVRRDTPLAGLDTGESDIAVLRGDAPPDADVRTRVLLYEPRVAAVGRPARPRPWHAAAYWTGASWRTARSW
ncbi:hypothetical protein SRIMM317S_01726 [Streptomyces rimosus subsp. rimosus]